MLIQNVKNNKTRDNLQWSVNCSSRGSSDIPKMKSNGKFHLSQLCRSENNIASHFIYNEYFLQQMTSVSFKNCEPPIENFFVLKKKMN